MANSHRIDYKHALEKDWGHVFLGVLCYLAVKVVPREGESPSRCKV